ncbi:GL27120 [Drosophila persimilis]|uniref:GL27120 n=1 Tax=Drosophila persimilis TaxID=7234 RepID=B4GYR8_DROPE|nr:uncharacterized protein LOC6598812 [Drosophila persimilis]EDW28187.1 GL27120 [Drosophila persimilis]
MKHTDRGTQPNAASTEGKAKDNEAATSSVRLLRIPRAAPSIENYGFHLTRSKWDPYPWVCEVATGTPAALCGLKTGDCVLEVNGVDVLGLRVADVAKIVKSQKNCVTILCWNSGCEKDCDKNSICCAPMPTSLRRLSVALESILRLIECPICNLTITPPAMQCQNGHVLCVDCRIRAERCPVCRDFYTPRRALLAEQIYFTIANAFEMCRSEDKLRQKLFAGITKVPVAAVPQPAKTDADQSIWRKRRPLLPTNKFLTKLLEGRSDPLENLFDSNAATLLRTNSTDNFNASNGTIQSAEPAEPTGTPRTTTMHPSHDEILGHLSLSTNDLRHATVKLKGQPNGESNVQVEGEGGEEESGSSHSSSSVSFCYLPTRPQSSDSLLFIGKRRPIAPAQQPLHECMPPNVNESSSTLQLPAAETPPPSVTLSKCGTENSPEEVVQTKPTSASLLYCCPCECTLRFDDELTLNQDKDQQRQQQKQQQKHQHQRGNCCCYKSAFRLL